jgi:hypothetical protein
MVNREKAGTRIKLIMTNDSYTNLIGGDTGTVQYEDDMGTLIVSWDNGSTMGLIAGTDIWEEIRDSSGDGG